jgi:hypothetical protein
MGQMKITIGKRPPYPEESYEEFVGSVEEVAEKLRVRLPNTPEPITLTFPSGGIITFEGEFLWELANEIRAAVEIDKVFTRAAAEGILEPHPDHPDGFIRTSKKSDRGKNH